MASHKESPHVEIKGILDSQEYNEVTAANVEECSSSSTEIASDNSEPDLMIDQIGPSVDLGFIADALDNNDKEGAVKSLSENKGSVDEATQCKGSVSETSACHVGYIGVISKRHMLGDQLQGDHEATEIAYDMGEQNTMNIFVLKSDSGESEVAFLLKSSTEAASTFVAHSPGANQEAIGKCYPRLTHLAAEWPQEVPEREFFKQIYHPTRYLRIMSFDPPAYAEISGGPLVSYYCLSFGTRTPNDNFHVVMGIQIDLLEYRKAEHELAVLEFSVTTGRVYNRDGVLTPLDVINAFESNVKELLKNMDLASALINKIPDDILVKFFEVKEYARITR